MTITNIRHIGIVVSDMERSLHFYRDLLGMEIWADFCDNSDYVQAVTNVPGANVRMVKLKAEGIHFHAPPTVSPDGGAKVTYCHDSEGVMIELVEILPQSASN